MTNSLDNIKKYIEDGEMSFLIGAGFSRNVNKEAYPMWGGLLKDAIWKMFGNDNRAKNEKKVMDKAVKEYGYLGIASMLVKKAGYHEAIDTYIESKTPYIKTVDGKPVLLLNGKQLHHKVNTECHYLLKNLEIQNIYTFNYDNALEFFMGEEARQALEVKISNTEHKIDELHRTIENLKQDEQVLKENIENASAKDNEGNFGIAVDNSDKEITDIQQLEQKLIEVQKNIVVNRVELNELQSLLDADKRNLKTYYNVVKDAYEISLSSKRKSIYKIHGSLRENAGSEYGFDGDKHAQYIITQEDYDSYNDKHGAFVNMMKIDLLRNRFCIMGVSGGDANFLNWINWVKDVLDKTKDRTKQGKESQHQSYFIYSGSENMPDELALMLKNHFIEPIILKDVFPKSKNDEERIKLFLEYLQPFSNKEAAKFSKLWGGIRVPKSITKDVKPVSATDAAELLRMSSFNQYNGPHSVVHYTAKDVQFAAKHYLKEGVSELERMVYAAALQSSLMPLDLSCGNDDLLQMGKETHEAIRNVYDDAYRRVALLQHLSGRNKKIVDADQYTRILYNLYDYCFPTNEEVEKIGKHIGSDFVKQYSLLQLLHADTSEKDKLEPGVFNSPQELVLAADWLKYVGYKNAAFYKRADDCKYQGRLLSLYDYCKGYLSAMHRKEEIDTYGNVSDTVYLDKYDLDVTNAAVLLNSLVELGICFAGRTFMDDTDWLEIVRALKQRYPVALIFYTIARNGNDKSIKLVAQELMYDDFSRRVLPSVLKNIIKSIVSDSTPVYLKGKMAQFASEVLPAIDQKCWNQLFVANAEAILDIADRYGRHFELSKSMYGFVANALEYLSAKELRLRLLERVLRNMDMDDQFGSYYNTLAISARDHLKPSDFAPLNDLFISFAKKTSSKSNQQATFIIMNLLVLVEGETKKKVLKMIEYKAVRDAFLVGGYAFHIKEYPELVDSFLVYYLNGEDLWHSGITNDGIHIGRGSVSVTQIDKLLHLNDEQLFYIYNDLKLILRKINKVLQMKKYPKEDKGWMSPENNFREVLMDMRLFVNKHQRLLSSSEDYEETCNNLIRTYNQCFFNKDVFTLIADDEIYRAIRKIMVEVEIYGIDKFRLEYELLIGKIIAKETKDLNTLFRHISWAMNYYKSFFNNEGFKKLFEAVLNIYRPYFDLTKEEKPAWNLIGCQKEVAEKALVSISKTIAGWGVKDEFWRNYKRIYFLK